MATAAGTATGTGYLSPASAYRSPASRAVACVRRERLAAGHLKLEVIPNGARVVPGLDRAEVLLLALPDRRALGRQVFRGHRDGDRRRVQLLPRRQLGQLRPHLAVLAGGRLGVGRELRPSGRRAKA